MRPDARTLGVRFDENRKRQGDFLQPPHQLPIGRRHTALPKFLLRLFLDAVLGPRRTQNSNKDGEDQEDVEDEEVKDAVLTNLKCWFRFVMMIPPTLTPS